MPEEIILTPAPSAALLAEQLIPEHHIHLSEARLLYLFTSQKRTRRGTPVLSTAKKLAPVERYLSSGPDESVGEGYDFLLLFTREEWDALTAAGRKALVDHTLCRCVRTERETKEGDVEYGWGIQDPDVEEFTEIVTRHGLWRPNLRTFGNQVRQLRLSDVAPEKPRDRHGEVAEIHAVPDLDAGPGEEGEASNE
jgi:hypothetical protein